jgi:hypothetical protein
VLDSCKKLSTLNRIKILGLEEKKLKKKPSEMIKKLIFREFIHNKEVFKIFEH